MPRDAPRMRTVDAESYMYLIEQHKGSSAAQAPHKPLYGGVT